MKNLTFSYSACGKEKLIVILQMCLKSRRISGANGFSTVRFVICNSLALPFPNDNKLSDKEIAERCSCKRGKKRIGQRLSQH